MHPHIFYSNRVEQLYTQFKNNIFSDGGSVFSRRLVVVPSQAIHQWLRLQMAQDPELGICAGVELCYLDQAIDSLYVRERRPPSGEELALRLEREIRAICREGASSVWDPVWNYLLVDEGKWRRRSQSRLSDLAEQLATLFRQYGLFGSEMVKEWQDHWQADLWHRLFPDGSPWDAKAMEVKGVDAVHLLTMSFVPPLTARLLTGAGCHVYFYHLSPCCAFWTDIRSDRESRGLRRFLEAKGVNKGSMDELEGYLRDRNALLANFGRMGRQMAEMLEEMGGEIEEEYVTPASLAAGSDELFDLSMGVADENLPSLLSTVQTDLLFLRNPIGDGKVEISEHDRSIQLHRAPSRRREVEILYDNLLRDMDPDFTASDVIVMAPDIMEYKSHIEAVFGRKESVLDYQIMDVTPEETNGLVRALFLFWELSESRFEVSALFALFDHPYFRSRWSLEEREVGRWRAWCKEVGIRWGGDVEHRNWLLKRNYCTNGLADGREAGTWEEGLRRLAEGLASGDLPLSLTEIPLLTKLMSIVRTLREDLAPLIDGTESRVSEWTQLQMELLEKYFHAPSGEWEWLETQVRRLRQAGEAVENTTFPFLSVQKLLKSTLIRQTVVVREAHLKSVRFCSMLPLRAIPVPTIALLGMEEGAFPGVNRLQSLNAMVGDQRAEYCPTRTDYDRYLFLETLLSVRKQLLISYRASENGDELAPSLLVAELFQYLDGGYTVEGKVPSKALLTEHPFSRFDAAYFQGDALQTFQEQAYELALRRYKATKEPPSHFIESWFHEGDRDESSVRPMEVTIEELDRFARNPLKAYLNQVLGLYVKGVEDAAEEDRFSLSALEKAKIRRAALERGETAAAKSADASGLLPSGLFRDVALQEVHEGVEEWQKHLHTFNTAIDSLFSVTLAADVERAEEVANRQFVVPAVRLELDGRELLVTGTIRELSDEGLLIYGRNTIEDVCRVWPRFLMMQLAEQLPMKSRDLLLLKSGERKVASTLETEKLLKEYLSVYFRNSEEPIPFIPEWIAPLLKGKKTPINLKETFEGSWRSVYSDELSWAFRGIDSLPGPELMERWRPDVERLFGAMVGAWFQK